jgi:hypothetical protein
VQHAPYIGRRTLLAAFVLLVCSLAAITQPRVLAPPLHLAAVAMQAEPNARRSAAPSTRATVTATEVAAALSLQPAGNAEVQHPGWRAIVVKRVLVGVEAVVEAERAAGVEPCVAATMQQLHTRCFREPGGRRVAFLLPTAAPQLPSQLATSDAVGFATAIGRGSPSVSRAAGARAPSVPATKGADAWRGAMLAVRDAYVLQQAAGVLPWESHREPRKGPLCGGRGVVVDVTTATVYDVSCSPGLDDSYSAGDVLHVPEAVHRRPVAAVSQRHTITFFHAVMETPIRLMYARGLALAGQVDVLFPAQRCNLQPYSKNALAALGFDLPLHGNDAALQVRTDTPHAPRQREPQRVLTHLHAAADIVLVPPSWSVAVRGMLPAMRVVALEGLTGNGQCGTSADPTALFRPYIMVLHRQSGSRDVVNLSTLVAHTRAAHPRVEFRDLLDLHQRNMTAKDYACAFQSACGLVSGHGAGLSHMMYLSPGAHVVEVGRPQQSGMRLFRTMASALSLVYTPVTAATAGPNATALDRQKQVIKGKFPAWHYASVTAEAPELLAALARVAATCQASGRPD